MYGSHKFQEKQMMVQLNNEVCVEEERLHLAFPFEYTPFHNVVMEIELLHMTTTELFALASCFYNLKKRNYIYMGFLHSARIAYWLSNYFNIGLVYTDNSTHDGKDKNMKLKYLDDVKSCVRIPI